MPDKVDTAEIQRLRKEATQGEYRISAPNILEVETEDIGFFPSLRGGAKHKKDMELVVYLVNNATVIADELDRLRAEIDRLNHEDNFDFFHISEKRIKELERQLADANKRIAELEAFTEQLADPPVVKMPGKRIGKIIGKFVREGD